MRRLGIVGKLATISACILLALGIAVTWFSLSQLRALIYEQSFRRLEAQGLNWIEANTAQVTVTRDRAVLHRLVAEFATRERIAYAVLVDATDVVLASFGVPEGLRRTDSKIASTERATVYATTAGNGLRYFEAEVIRDGMSRDLDTMFNLAAGPGVEGQGAVTFRLAVTQSGLEDELYTLLGRNAALSAALGILALLLQTVLARRVVGPVVSIGRAAREIAAGRLDHRVRDGAALKNEVGELVRNFNDMAQRMHELHAGLEEKVGERTRELEVANEKLKVLDQQKSQFLSTVSHEFRTPLTSIKAFAQILLDSPLDQERRTRYLNIIDTESDRLSRLISGLLDLAKIESGRVEWANKVVDLAQVVGTAVVAVMPQAAEEHIGVEISDGAPHLVSGDPDRLQQVVTNLLANALKFCPAGTHVAMSVGRSDSSGPAKQRGEYCIVSVRDEGPGISPEDRARVFDRFYTGRNAQNGSKGTGLGLAISREIVTHHGGEIWVESELGAGSTFRFTLPAVKAEALTGRAAGEDWHV